MRALLSVLAIPLAACGASDSMGSDAALMTATCGKNGGEACFELPTEAVMVKTADGTSSTPANVACAAKERKTSEKEIVVSGLVKDFQTGNGVSGAKVDAFLTLDFSKPDVTVTADPTGAYSLTLPVGTPNFMNWRTREAMALDTYSLAQNLDVSQDEIENYERGSVSQATADALPAFIGVTRSPGLGVLAGSALDCDGKSVMHAIANISTTSSAGNAAPTFVPGVQVYYFSAGATELPTRRTKRADSNSNGLFVLIEIPPSAGTTQYYLQTWGFVTAEDVAKGKEGLKLLSEYEAPVVGDSVIAIDLLPTQGPL